MLVREAAATARASLVPTILVALVVAGTCLAALLTVGRQAATEAVLAEQIAGPAARTLTTTVTGEVEGITPPMVAVLASLTGTEAVLATSLPRDTVLGTLGPGSKPIAVIAAFGTTEGALSITEGRAPLPGEVVLSASSLAALGLIEPVGYL